MYCYATRKDDLRGLAKVMDSCGRLSILFVYQRLLVLLRTQIVEWRINIGVVDRILLNFQPHGGCSQHPLDETVCRRISRPLVS